MFEVLFISLAIGIVLYGLWGPLPVSQGLWCPNIVSLLGVLTRAGAYFFLFVIWKNPIAMFFLYLLGAVCDIIDGRMGRKYDKVLGKTNNFSTFRSALLYGGTSDYGALWDSSLDKIGVMLVYPPTSWMAWHGGYKDIAILFILVALTDLISGIHKLTKFSGRRRNKKNHSKNLGKVKTWAQHLVLIPWVFMNPRGDVLPSLLLITLGLTLGSMLSQMLVRDVGTKSKENFYTSPPLT